MKISPLKIVILYLVYLLFLFLSFNIVGITTKETLQEDIKLFVIGLVGFTSIVIGTVKYINSINEN